MATSPELRLARVLRIPVALRRAGSWALGSFALITAMIVYCELCSLVTGLPAPGLAVSGPWALQVSLGWILVGTALGSLGPRVATSRMASTYPRALIVSSIAGSAAFTLCCEALLAQVSSAESSMAALIYGRAPLNIAVSALLIVLYAGNRIWTQREVPGWRVPSAQEPTVVERSLRTQPVAQTHADSHGPIEVMTGTGRTTVRLEHVECLQADRNYINVMHASGRTYLLRQTLTALERSLDPDRFIRIHRSIIVNREMITEHRRGGVLVLQSGRTVRISRAFRKCLH